MTEFTSRPLRVFLCHYSVDKPTVRELYQKLSAEGWIDVWLDEQKLFPGMDWNLEIERAVEEADVIIVCLSSNSVTKEGYVQRELKYALDIALEKPEGTIFVIPLRLDNCEPPRRLRGWQYADYFPESLRPWAYQRVLESLKIRAKLLGISSNGPEKTPVQSQITQSPSKPQIPEVVKTFASLIPKSTKSVAHPSASTKHFPFWKYGRLIVIFLVILGFFGPWFEIRSCSPLFSTQPVEDTSTTIMTGPEAYSEFLSSHDLRVVIPWMVGVLFVLTLMRLIPWKYRENKVVIRSERFAAGITPPSMFIAIVGTLLDWGGSQTMSLLWGFWLTLVGNYLAPLNILFEFRSSKQKGQKPPWWIWLLGVITILPWLIIALLILWIVVRS